MTFLRKLFKSEKPVQRVRICVECGMPVSGEHKEWCSILKGPEHLRQSTTESQAAG